MKIEIKKTGPLSRELTLTIPRDKVSQKFDEVYAEFSQKSKVKGFRAGKAPRHVLEQQFGPQAKDETLKRLVPEAYQDALIQEKLSPIDYPEISDTAFRDGTVFFRVKVEIRPEVKVKSYKGIKVTRKSSKVTDDDIQETLENVRQAQAKTQKKDDIKIDDDFAHGLGFPKLDDFKAYLSRQLEIEKDRANRLDVENQVAGHLLKQVSFPLPQRILKKQTAHRLKETQDHLKKQGMSDDEINKREEEMHKHLKTAVERDFKLFLIFEQIAKEENITVGERESLPAKVMEFLLKEAEWT